MISVHRYSLLQLCWDGDDVAQIGSTKLCLVLKYAMWVTGSAARHRTPHGTATAPRAINTAALGDPGEGKGVGARLGERGACGGALSETYSFTHRHGGESYRTKRRSQHDAEKPRYAPTHLRIYVPHYGWKTYISSTETA